MSTLDKANSTYDKAHFFSLIRDNKKAEIQLHFQDTDNRPWEYLDVDNFSSNKKLI